MIGHSGSPSPLPVNAYWAWILQCLGCPHVCSVICTLSPCYFCTNPAGVWYWVNRCGLFTGGNGRAKRHHDGESCSVTGHYVGKLTEMLEESEVEAVKVTTKCKSATFQRRKYNFLTTWQKEKSALNHLTWLTDFRLFSSSISASCSSPKSNRNE